MTRTFEQWAESEGLDMSVDWKGDLTSPVTAGALRGWEAAQSAGQEPIYQARTGVSEWADLSRLQFERIKLDKRIVYTAPVQSAGQEAVVIGHVYPEGGRLRFADKSDTVAKHMMPLMRPVCYADAAPVNGGEPVFLAPIRKVSREELAEMYSECECPGCEGKPAPQNNPCAVCGKRAADVQQERLALREAVARKTLALQGDAADMIGPATHAHNFELQPSSGIELCTYCGLGRIAARAADAQQVGAVAQVTPEEQAEINAALDRDDEIACSSCGLTMAQSRALTSPAKVPDAVMQALDRMSTPLHDSRLSGLTAELDAANIKTIRDYVLSGAMPAKVVGDDQHPDDAAVDRFSVAMKAKLAKKRAQGRGGWDDERVCSPDDLARMLVDHVRKGDPVDVGNFAMMLFNRPDSGAALCRAALSADGGEDKRDAERYRIVREMESSNFDNLSIRLPEQIDAYVDAIAANQAEGE